MVTIRSLSKKYCTQLRTSLWYGLRDIGAEIGLSRGRAAGQLRRHEFWSLHNVSFELGRGEALAIIGDNGAGKSTLLKVLNGLIKPDAGFVRLAGRVGALIELGVGLDPVLSGRENIFLRAALLGVPRPQVLPLLPAIIDFTGLGDAIEMPVQFYSSGMVARLAYAVAAHLHPDILLVDEVLAVGDFDFQRKCLNHMRQYLAAGGTLILVSHQPHHIQSVCQRGLVLEKGAVVFDGSATAALDFYFAQQAAEALPTPATTEAPRPGAAPSPQRPVIIEQMQASGPGSGPIETGQTLTIQLDYTALHPLENLSWGFYLYTADGNVCITGGLCPHRLQLDPGAHTLTGQLPHLPLTAGNYLLKGAIFEHESFQPLAIWGWENTPTYLSVAAAPSVEKNIQNMLQQLILLDIEWA